MLNTLTQHLAGISDPIAKETMRQIIEAIGDRYSSQALNTAALVIKAGGGILAKTGGVTTHFLVKGKYVSLAAATDMPSLVGLVITATKFNVACFFVDQAGTLSVAFGQEGAAAVNVKFPQFPKGKALVGFLLITHSATFTGGTTALDTATTLYISPVGPSDPSVLI